MPHIAKTDRKKIQRSQTEGAKHQKSEDSTTGKKVSYRLESDWVLSCVTYRSSVNSIVELIENLNLRALVVKFKLNDSVWQVEHR